MQYYTITVHYCNTIVIFEKLTVCLDYAASFISELHSVLACFLTTLYKYAFFPFAEIVYVGPYIAVSNSSYRYVYDNA